MGIALPPSFSVPPSTGNQLPSLCPSDKDENLHCKNADSLNRRHVCGVEKVQFNNRCQEPQDLILLFFEGFIQGSKFTDFWSHISNRCLLEISAHFH